jgi:hypothetical protein
MIDKMGNPCMPKSPILKNFELVAVTAPAAHDYRERKKIKRFNKTGLASHNVLYYANIQAQQG